MELNKHEIENEITIWMYLKQSLNNWKVTGKNLLFWKTCVTYKKKTEYRYVKYVLKHSKLKRLW